MVYLVADPSTYLRVAHGAMHALAAVPTGMHEHELVLLGEKRAPNHSSHRQVQYLAKVLAIREPAAGALEKAFPGSTAMHDWPWVVDLYWSARLDEGFNLNQIPDLDYLAYRNVQVGKRFSDADQKAVLDYLLATNEPVLKDFLNRADPDERRATR